MKKAALHNLGCKVNAYETEAMEQMLRENGYEIVPFSEVADVYVINTCSVTNMADRKSRQMIHRARKKNADAIIVGAGCYIQTARDAQIDLASLGCDILLGNNQKHRLVELLEGFEKDRLVTSVADINVGLSEYEHLSLLSPKEHTRAFVKIQDGCNQFCSYCIIPYARGRVRSRGFLDVIGEISHLAENGYREVVLTGIHITSYRDGDKDLIDVIEAVNHIQGIERIRLSSLEPRVITEEFCQRLSGIEKLCPHFHLSLQSGCDETLLRMNRKYDTAEYAAGVELLRSFFSLPAITTDIIVGFPGETEEEFSTSLSFAQKIGFYEMHIFPYSIRQGTKAATMQGQILAEIKNKRSEQFLAASKEMNRAYRESYIGREASALVEEATSIEGKTYWTGLTKEYIRIAIPKSDGENLVNKIVTGKIDGFLGGEEMTFASFTFF